MMKIFILLSIFLSVSFSITAKATYKNNSILASGKWIKVASKEEGIQKITYNQLKEWGINSPENVAVYSNGGYMLPKMNAVEYPDDLVKLTIHHSKDYKNNDCIFFYSTGSVSWNYNPVKGFFEHTANIYSDKTFFFISSDVEKSLSPEVKSATQIQAEKIINTYNDFQVHENQYLNILKTGRRWYGEEINHSTSKTFTFDFSNAAPNTDANLTLAAASGATSDSFIDIQINDKSTGTLNFRKISHDEKAFRYVGYYTFPSSEKNKVKLSFDASGKNGIVWIDYLVINQISNLKFNSAHLTFRNVASSNYNSLTYQINSSVQQPILWEITDPTSPKTINFSKNGNIIEFTDEGNTIRTYLVFDPKNESVKSPEFIGNVSNQNIHGLPVYDYIMVTHPKFIEPTKTLADFHRQKNNLKVLVVTTDEIYNEFSSGLPDVSAIRNMAKMFYHQKTTTDSLRYILLMGDGSYNNRNPEKSEVSFIPTYQSVLSETEGSYVSDDFFVLLDEKEGEASGDIDIGIGRIPCRTIEEAELVVNKTINYSSTESLGNWRNVLAFIADDEDSNTHMSQTEDLIEIINTNYTGFNFDKIYFDSYQQVSTSGGNKYPEASETINRRVDDGALILNYVGHANAISLAHEDVIGMSDINSWSNKNKLPVFVTATCEFSRFDDDKMSGGEQILFNPAGGGVALFSTTRVVYSNSNFNLSSNFYHSVFEQDKNGEKYRLGDIMRMAKNKTRDTNSRNFTLLGDPALQLAFPKYKVVTKNINGMEIQKNDSIQTDSTFIGALDKVTVSSEVHDHKGNILSNYSGTVSIIVYDKEINVQTLANDGGRKFEYKAQNNIIYKGISSVTNGKFQFSFIVPKDISYSIERGKISYYTSNKEFDGNGSSTEFFIGGSSKNPLIDNTPPEVDIYLNNEHFKPNDRVSSSALLLVNFFDESGINMAGTGIGHDIVAILDGDNSNPMVMNDFYTSQLNSYQRGQVLFPINNMSPGEHTISIKVWDVQNNSTVKEVSFIVEEGFEITSVFNVPNPVEFETRFEIQHNLPGDVFETNIEIFNLRGIRIHEIKETVGSYGSVSASIRWDTSESNFPINNEKILVYRVTMKNKQGLKATGAGKLLLIKNN